MRIGEDLPTLASPDDIVDRLGRNLNQVEAARIDALLRDGSALIRRYCRQDFISETNYVDTFVADAGEIRLSNRPVNAVNSVTWLSGNQQLLQNFPITWYVFDGIDKITIPNPYESGIINLPYMWYLTMWYSDSYIVDYDFGYANPPNEAVSVLCTAIISELATPTMSATLASESIGPYSYSMRRTSGAGLNAALIDAGMQTALKDFRRPAGTIAVRTLCILLRTGRRLPSFTASSPVLIRNTAMTYTQTLRR
jgi:hypothetical protein